MNFKRQRPRVNYPIMKKGGKHMVSRKSVRKDGKRQAENQKQEYYIDRKESESQVQSNWSGHVWYSSITEVPVNRQSGIIPRS